MKQELGQYALSVAQNPKTAPAVTTVTTAVGLLNLVPGALGLGALCLGISLQLVLRRKGRLESERIELQKEKLQLEINLLKGEAGEPCREERDQQS